MIQRAIEAVGISTVSITLVQNITEQVKPPRALVVPYRFGYPLGEPNNPTLHHKIISAALSLLQENQPLPILEAFTP